MKYSLRSKLSLSYVFIVLLLVLLTSISSNLFLEKHFRNYVKTQQEQRNREIAALIGQQFRGGDVWEREVIQDIGINALENGMILKVKDANSNIIWDATAHNSGLCTEMLAHMAGNMESRYRNFNGRYIVETYPVKRDFRQVGIVEIGYYGPFYFDDSDLAFINSLNRILIGVGLFSLVLSLAFGAFMARHLSRPISRVINAAGMIAGGYFQERVVEKSDTIELGQLTATINNLAETLEKQDILRKRTSADVAHELRTPLATLQSHLEAMLDGIWEADTKRLQSCHEEVIRMSRLVGDLEKLAKYEGENIILDKEIFDLSDLIGAILLNFESDFKARNIKLEFNSRRLNVYADRDKLGQVVVNLLSNALKYTREGGIVQVEAEATAENIRLAVRDNGIGIPAEDLPHIFERFYRVDKSRNRLTGGSGIGLSIVKTIVDAHKWQITAASKPGRGSEFIIILPSVKPGLDE